MVFSLFEKALKITKITKLRKNRILKISINMDLVQRSCHHILKRIFWISNKRLFRKGSNISLLPGLFHLSKDPSYKCSSFQNCKLLMVIANGRTSISLFSTEKLIHIDLFWNILEKNTTPLKL